MSLRVGDTLTAKGLPSLRVVGVQSGHYLVEDLDNFGPARRLSEDDQIAYEVVAGVPERTPDHVGWTELAQRYAAGA